MNPSKQPELMRAFQRDEEIRLTLRSSLLEALETFIKYRNILKWEDELLLTADLFYFGVTTLKGSQTLGEEYCGIAPRVDGVFPRPLRRILLGMLSIVAPYLIKKVIRKY